MIERDYYENISQIKERLGNKGVQKTIKKIPIKKGKIIEPLKRILVIGPDYPERCHFSENIYDHMKEMQFDVKMLGDMALPVTPINIEKGLPLSLGMLISKMEGWKPQLTIIDQININFTNDQQTPVFYHHREFKRPPTVFYPTVVFFWHNDILRFYETIFAKEWMAQVQSKQILPIAFNPKRYQPQEKEYLGVIGIGFREPSIDSYIYTIDELTEVAPILLLNQEYEYFKKLGFQMFDTPVTDDKYREILPKCEAIWVPLSVRQYTSRRMIEAMACKTLVILKLESKKHEESLQQIGFENGKHYIGVNRLDDIKEAFTKPKNKKQMVENAYQVVMERHTYQARIKEMIQIYNEVTK